MGVFTVRVKLRNWQNRYLTEDRQGEDVECDALVDSGAAELALPAEMINRLKLEELGPVQVYTADGGQHTYRVLNETHSSARCALLAGRSPLISPVVHTVRPTYFEYNMLIYYLHVV